MNHEAHEEHEGEGMAVELRPAYVWDCPECGREVFSRGLVPEMDPEETAEIRDELGLQPWEEGNLVMMPESVRCPHCKTEHATVHFSESP